MALALGKEQIEKNQGRLRPSKIKITKGVNALQRCKGCVLHPRRERLGYGFACPIIVLELEPD